MNTKLVSRCLFAQPKMAAYTNLVFVCVFITKTMETFTGTILLLYIRSLIKIYKILIYFIRSNIKSRQRE